ncbi:hypothetical protein ACJMK2_023515, partial [Sinanodonta woodiana]
TYSLPAGRPLSSDHKMDIILSEISAMKKVPLGVKDNVSIVLNNAEEKKKKQKRNLQKNQKHYWDDCGAWD